MSNKGSIIRVEKRGGFTVLDNTAALDSRLSFKALGIHTYLMTRVDTWQVYAEQLAKTHKDGIEAVYSGLRELEQHGYLVRRTIRNEKGHIVGRESVVYERPVDTTEHGKTVSGEIPVTGNPCHGKPQTNKYLPSTSTEVQQVLTPMQPQKLVLPEWLPEEVWGDWIQHRKEIKKPVTPTSAKRLLSSLEGAKAKGHDPVGLIEQAIERGWQGVVIPKDVPATSSAPRRAGRPANQAEANQRFMEGVQETVDAVKGVFDE